MNIFSVVAFILASFSLIISDVKAKTCGQFGNFSEGLPSDQYVSEKVVDCEIRNCTPGTDKNGPIRCKDRYCEAYAGLYRGSMRKSSVNPCEDFYSFVCTGWDAKNFKIIHYETHEYDQILHLKLLMQDFLIDLLEKPEEKHAEFSRDIIMKMKSLNEKCNLELCQARNVDALRDGLKDMLRGIGGFPVIGMKLDTNYNLAKALAYAARNLNIRDIFFSVDVQKDILNPANNIIILGNPSASFRNSFYDFNSREDFKQKVWKLLHPLLDDPESCEMAYKHIDELADFAEELAKISDVYPPDELEYSIFLKNRFSMDEVSDKFRTDKMDITDFLEKVFYGVRYIDESATVINISSIKELKNIIDKNKIDTIANYIGWRVVSDYAALGGLYKRYHEIENCEMYCSLLGFKYFDLALVLYGDQYRFHSSKEEKQNIKHMMQELKVAMGSAIVLADGMEYEVKVEALFKIAKMNDDTFLPIKESYANRLKDIFKYYMSITGNILKIVTAIQKDKSMEVLNSLRGGPDEYEGFLRMQNKYQPHYDPVTNMMLIPPGYARFPFYFNTLPKAINYGGMGVAVAREMTKAISKSLYHHRGGLEMDSRGKLKEMNPGNFSSFDRAFHCIRNNTKYILNSTLIKDGYKYNYNQTTYEDMSDEIALRIAYKAYKLHKARFEEEDILLYKTPYNSDQLFFISWAYSMCGNHRPDAPISYFKGKTQSPHKARVLASIRNNDDFKRTFKCKNEDSQNLEPCKLWCL